MRINIKVNTKASCNEVVKNIVTENLENVSTIDYRVRTTALPAKGKANQAVILLLADYFKIGRKSIKIIKGEKSNLKTIETDV